MSLRLKAQHDGIQLELSSQPIVLGRLRQLGISSTSVSRHACSCFQEGEHEAKLVAHKAIYIRRQNSNTVVPVAKDATCKVQRDKALTCLEDLQIWQTGLHM